ncbi:hypothetical protein Ait01nite_073510 [Actinoplanes italicus]|uniref:Uncharacterized protein DUF1877 n=1 Tax=Actinoplanes italicus TaxID=113567 RepID=A0A2T0K0B6_9ACTN|nr:DUF1877 family protein [Actinoplanes italicus]PRX16231.1 uncharacterized protein DUF1877 [Actinoplanes italicus]GIE34306.1 hypothetical protein Ait01nite_073510 [Actinoplanes italicus]
MSVVTYYSRPTPEQLDELRRLLDSDVLAALEHLGGLPGSHIDRAWAGLHFLLLDLDAPVDVINGGEPLTEAHPVRLLTAGDVATAAGFLAATPFTALAGGYDRALMESIGVYPEDLWEAEWALSYLEDNYTRLTAVFGEAAAAGDPLLVHRS